MQDASEQRPHKLSYRLKVKGAEAEQAVAALEQVWPPSGRGFSLRVSEC